MNKVHQILRSLINFDYWLILAIIVLFVINGFIQYSANDEVMNRVYSDGSYLGLSFILMLVIAGIHINKIRSFAIPLYIVSLILILLVLVIGVKVNGARRWLNLGIRIQPSELCKLSVPLMVAYVLSVKNHILTYKDYGIGFVLIIVPFLLIAKQPDLGTGILVFSAGFLYYFLLDYHGVL